MTDFSYGEVETVDFGETLGFGRFISKVSSKRNRVAPISQYDDAVFITMNNGDQYVLWHEQNCCENVSLEEVIGDIEDLIDSMIIKAELVVSHPAHPPEQEEWEIESRTWSFYKIQTHKGEVVFRWHGSSNGYYSETVSFSKLTSLY